MKRRKRTGTRMLLTGLLAGALAVCAAGCSLPNSNENTSISADETGVITETVVESVGQDTFTEDELKQYIEQEISDYTAGGGGKVTLTKCTVSNSTAETVMTYATCADYAGFNHVTCFLGTIKEAEDAGYDVDQAFVDSHGAAADSQVISERAKEWKIFICEEPVQVRLPDKILYATDNVTITGRLTATVNSVLNSDSSSSSNAVVASSAAGSKNTSTDTMNPYATVSDFYAYIIYK